MKWYRLKYMGTNKWWNKDVKRTDLTVFEDQHLQQCSQSKLQRIKWRERVFSTHKSAWMFFFTSISVQGASAGGLPRVVWGAGGAGDLQSVPGPDGRPPPALLPRRWHAGPEPRSASAAAATGRVENLWRLSACETSSHHSYYTSNHFIHILYEYRTLTASVPQWRVNFSAVFSRRFFCMYHINTFKHE